MKNESNRIASFNTAVKQGFLGTAMIRVCNPEAPPTLKFGTFNGGRELQEDLIRHIAAEMVQGRCNNRSNPLIAAVPTATIQLECLTEGYDGVSELRPVKYQIPSQVKSLEVLAGLQRVEASRRAIKTLQDRVARLKKTISRLQDAETSEDQTSGVVTVSSNQSSIQIAHDELEQVSGLIERIQAWPVHFYDIGEWNYITIHFCKVNDSPPFEDKLRKVSKTLQTVKKCDQDVLLRFLAQNSQDKSVSMTPKELFIEILSRNLHSPRGA